MNPKSDTERQSMCADSIEKEYTEYKEDYICAMDGIGYAKQYMGDDLLISK